MNRRLWASALAVALAGGVFVVAVGSDADTAPAPAPDPTAERMERDALLDLQARTHLGTEVDASFVPGSRRMPR